MKKQQSFKQRENMTMYMFTIPAIILFSMFVIVPFVRGIFLSATNWNGYSQHYKIVGLKNYGRLFTDQNVWRALINTLIYGCGSTLLQNVFGLLFALYLNKKFAGRTFGRTVIYLPVMIAPLIMGYVMYFFFTLGGAMNDIRSLFNQAPLDWLADGKRGVIIMTLINSWQFVGISMVIYLAGLQSIPDMYYEAAEIDGFSGWRLFTNITFPLLSPALTSSIVINLIGGLKLFDVIMALTKGGPGYDSHSLSTLINRTYFGSENGGYAAAIGLFAFLLIGLISYFATDKLTKYQEAQS
ncbi:MAG: sugar ABC transporter permease [Treponema sp.]|jgi:raffinose/stachyose/melibiose transport system permease protein|nr:sugar ABC transporter permease [Treponema sp.]